MPRASTIAQADIARTLRAFRAMGVAAEVRIYPDGMVIVTPGGKEDEPPAARRFDKEEEIRL